MVTKRRQVGVWIYFLLLYPTFFYLTYRFSSQRNSIFEIDYLIFISLGIAVALFPITIDGRTIFLINSVSIATFLIYGLQGEMILTTVSTIALMIRIGIRKDEHYRYPINIQHFQFMSLSAALVYTIFNPYIDIFGFYNYDLILLFLYLITFLLVNQFLIAATSKVYFKKKNVKIFEKNFKFSLVSTLYTIPAAVILVFLYKSFSLLGIIIMGVPLVAVSISFNLYYRTKTTNQYLQKANKLAQKLTGQKSRTDVVNIYLKALPDIFPTDTLALYDITTQKKLKLIRFYNTDDEYQEMDRLFKSQGRGDTIIEEAWHKDKIIVYNKADDWIYPMSDEIDYPAESVIAIPVKRELQIVGVFMLTNKKQKVFDADIVAVLKVLHNYFNISLDNAKHYEKLRLNSETDHLTGLPNLRSFEQTVANYHEFNPNEIRSLIVLDLDHFKSVNDSYGHETGNDLLRQFADMLRTFVDKEGDIARYGGEEFLVFLPKYSKERALEFAEALRQTIEESSFSCQNHIAHGDEIVHLELTASIGVATYPGQGTNSGDLIIHADRAMYVGSKRNGRNKVTAFSMEG